jgi:tagaturonate reductase
LSVENGKIIGVDMQLKRSLLDENSKIPEDLQINPVAKMPERVIQFGEGNFLRAFVDWMVDRLNGQGLFNGCVVIVQPIERGLVNVLNEQEGLYTLLLRGIENGQVIEQKRLITSVSRGVNPYTDWDVYLGCAENPDLRVVISNTTEAGIAYEKEAFSPGRSLKSFPAKLTAFLYHRFQFFGGDQQKGMLIFPCELIDKNGQHLRGIILKLIDEWGLDSGFKAWVENHNHFFNTLVDRIVTGYPRDEADALCPDLGYEDQLLDTGEIFHLWVIEGETRFKDEFPLHQLGLNVVWTDELKPYRERKVRMLNGAHTMTVAVAYLSGLDTVKAAVEDSLVGDFMGRSIFNEILPMLKLPEAEKKAFAESVLERFQNPYIHHRWLDISLNCISKFKTRCLPTLVDYIEAHGSPPPHLSFALAAMFTFYRGAQLKDGYLEATRPQGTYLVKDDLPILEFFLNTWQNHKGENLDDYQVTAAIILANSHLWGRDLNELPGVGAAVAKALHQINTDGLNKALENLLAMGGQCHNNGGPVNVRRRNHLDEPLC